MDRIPWWNGGRGGSYPLSKEQLVLIFLLLYIIYLLIHMVVRWQKYSRISYCFSSFLTVFDTRTGENGQIRQLQMCWSRYTTVGWEEVIVFIDQIKLISITQKRNVKFVTFLCFSLSCRKCYKNCHQSIVSSQNYQSTYNNLFVLNTDNIQMHSYSPELCMKAINKKNRSLHVALVMCFVGNYSSV